MTARFEVTTTKNIGSTKVTLNRNTNHLPHQEHSYDETYQMSPA